MDPGSSIPVVGASGAISGLMAAYAVFYRKARLTWMLIVIQFRIAAPWWVLIWFGLNVLGFLAGQQGIAWGAHLGGFLMGLVLALLLDRGVLRRNPRVRLVRDL
jgi:membrane associated rhomboid family serine protease